jgi:hypothetical protein
MKNYIPYIANPNTLPGPPLTELVSVTNMVITLYVSLEETGSNLGRVRANHN